MGVNWWYTTAAGCQSDTRNLFDDSSYCIPIAQTHFILMRLIINNADSAIIKKYHLRWQVQPLFAVVEQKIINTVI